MTKKKLRDAMEGSLGIISTVAKKAVCDRRTIYRYLEKYPDLRRELEIERDKILDRAESVLFEKVNQKNWKATEFILNKLGGQRGYANREIVDNKISADKVTGDSFAEAWDKVRKDLKEQSEYDKSN